MTSRRFGKLQLWWSIGFVVITSLFLLVLLTEAEFSPGIIVLALALLGSGLFLRLSLGGGRACVGRRIAHST